MRTPWGIRFFCALLLGVGLAGASARSQEIITSRSGTIQLETGVGALVRLSGAAKTVFVADPAIADVQVKSPRLIYLSGKAPGSTTLFAVDGQDRLLANHRLEVSHNLGRLRESLKSMMPDASLDVRSVNSSIVINGSVTDAVDAAEVRRMAEQLAGKPENVVMKVGVTAPTQVHLRVRVAEVSRDVLKQFGINWDAVFNTGNFVFGLATGNPVQGGDPASFLGGVSGFDTVVRNGGTNSLFGLFKTGSVDINGLIDALDNEGLVTVLAQPNLTSTSGKPATFLAGGEFPIVVGADDDRVTVEFKSFGVSLSFTPTILSTDRISLFVNPEVSQLSSEGAVEIGGFKIPALTTRRAETTVELGSGQSFVIGGLLQNNSRHDVDKFPGLGDIPILGTLFRSDRFQRNESELVIIVTPYIVQPVSAPMLAAPTDGLTPPTDTDRILHGRLYHPSAPPGEAPPTPPNSRAPRAPVGFVLD